MFGFRADERITFAVLRERVHPDDREAMERDVRSALDDRKPYDCAIPREIARWRRAMDRRLRARGIHRFRRASQMHGVCRDITERRPEQLETARLEHEIAHVGRVSMMGQLASALAHEINQPLSAILRNAEAAELFMQSETPDLEEIRAILADIRSDDQRAGNVIDRMRALLKRHDIDTQVLDLPRAGRQAAGLARADAVNRHVKLEVELPQTSRQCAAIACTSSRCC